MSNTRTPFCKICFDAKKPASDYNSHYVRASMDPKSAITCPILMATECRYCHGFGHTISRCEVRERNNQKRAAHAAAPAPAPAAVAPAKEPLSNNKFALLEEEEQPVLCQPSNGYARAARAAPAVSIPAPVARPVVVQAPHVRQQRQEPQQRYNNSRPYLSRREYEERERNTVEAQRREAELKEAQRIEEERMQAQRIEEQNKSKQVARRISRTPEEWREVDRIRALIALQEKRYPNARIGLADPDEDW